MAYCSLSCSTPALTRSNLSTTMAIFLKVLALPMGSSSGTRSNNSQKRRWVVSRRRCSELVWFAFFCSEVRTVRGVCWWEVVPVLLALEERRGVLGLGFGLTGCGAVGETGFRDLVGLGFEGDFVEGRGLLAGQR